MAAGAARRDAAGGSKKAAGTGPPKNPEPAELEPSRPRRAAATQEARLAHMLGKDGEFAAWLIKNPSALTKVAKQKVAAATIAAQSAGQAQLHGESNKRKRPQMTNLLPEGDTSDEEADGGDDADGKRVAEREASLELSVGGSDYAPNKDGEDGEEESDGGVGDDLEEDGEELESQEEAAKVQPDVGADDEEDEEDGSLGELLAGIPGKKKKRKKNNGKAKSSENERAIVPLKKKPGGKSGGNQRRTAAGELVLNAASTGLTFDANLLLMSLLKVQQAQAEQLARNDRFEKLLSQAVSINKRRGHGASQQSPDSTTTASTSVTQQVGVSDNQLGLLDKLKANPQLINSAKSTIKLLASDAVNLSLLASGVPDSELMASNTKLAFRVGPDPEQEELFDELYQDFIQAHQMDKFRQKRGQTVSTIRATGAKQYSLPAAGTEDWSRITTELLAGDAYRRAGTDAYGDPRFRTVLAKSCGVDVDHQPVPDQMVVTLSRLALVEVVLELQFRGIKRLERQELKMLQIREEALVKEPRDSSFVVVVAPEDPSVCPVRLQSRAAERAKALAAAHADEHGQVPQLDESDKDPMPTEN